jgi:hypothetical protein
MPGMSFLRRLLGGSKATWPPPGPITEWPVGDLKGDLSVDGIMFEAAPRMVDVVGESAHQGSIDRIAGGRTIDGARIRDHSALLMPEPTNPYDVNAVRVVIISSMGSGATVGYLSREDAVAYRPVIDRLAADGKVAACRASISGGWDRGSDDRGSFGVRLSLGTPEALVKELDAP